MKKLSLLTCLLLIISCAPKIKKFDMYQKAPLLKADIFPSSEEVEGRPLRVAIFPLENNDIAVAKQSKLGASIAVQLENVLMKDKLIELLDRKAYKKLKKEVALAEMGGEKSYTGPKVADYVIDGSINRAEFSSGYVAAVHDFDATTGKYTYIPPKWKYNSVVGGNIKVYSMPSLAVVKSFTFNGKAYKSENANSKQGAKKRDDFLVKEAAKRALNKIDVDIKNFFAKKGYILEKRVLKKKVIFKISLGSNDGIKRGDRLIIYSKKTEKNPITGKSEMIESVISEGRVSDKINNESAWIVVKDKKKGNRIRVGDVVKIKYKKNVFKSIVTSDMTKSITKTIIEASIDAAASNK